MNTADIFLNKKTGKIKRESTNIEYKENIGKNSYWKIQKAMLGLANNKGGIIVIGVTDLPRKIIDVGDNTLEKEFELFQHTINDRYGNQIEYSMECIKIDDKSVGVISVKEATDKPLICTSSDGDLKTGSIYYRYMGESTFIKKNELDKIIDSIKKKEAKRWEKIFKAIINKGINNVAVMDLNSGEIGTNGKFYIDSSTLSQLKQKVNFIEEGNFSEKDGAPTLKLVGEVVPQNVIYSKNGGFDASKYKYSATDVKEKLGININQVKPLIKYLKVEGNDEYYTEIKYSKNTIIKYTESFIKLADKKIPKGSRDYKKLKAIIDK